MRLISPLLLTLLTAALAHADDRGADRRAAAKRYEFRVEKQGWKGANQADLRAVFNSATSEIAVHFDGKEKFEFEPIRVRRDNSGPIVLFKRSLRGEIVMLLSSSGTYWSQHSYQVAHEFCHILCRYKEGDKTNLWFEESLCELASIYALRQMAITWQTSPPYRNWKDYGKSLKEYADDVAGKYPVPDGLKFATWFKINHDKLSKKATQRELNGIVAVQLLPIFEKSPAAWRTLPYLNVDRGKKKQTFSEYLKAWHDNTPEELRPHVDNITKQFKR